MMTLTARLCALCAVCALSEMVLPKETQRGGIRMIGGMLMLHLVLSGAQALGRDLLDAEGLGAVFDVLIR